MSVDTYLKGKNVSGYHTVEVGDVKVLVSAPLYQWAKHVSVETSRFLFWTSFELEIEPRRPGHLHGPN